MNIEKFSEVAARWAADPGAMTRLERAQLAMIKSIQQGREVCFVCQERMSMQGARLIGMQRDGWVLVAMFCARCRQKLDAKPAFCASIEARLNLHLSSAASPPQGAA